MILDKKKKKWSIGIPQVGITLAAITFGLVFATATTNEDKVVASYKESFTVVAKDEIETENTYTLKHKKTGCYYILSVGWQNDVALTQMMVPSVNKTGSMPYCKK